jgi:ABC-type Mn2+/Zn2+ transport system permease subunit
MSATVRRPIQLKRMSLVGFAAAAAIATGVASAVLFSGDSDGTAPVKTGVPTKPGVLLSLAPEQRRYVEGITSAAPEQLAAAFGTGSVGSDRPALKPGANTR